MKTRETELAYTYLTFDLLTLNLALAIMASYSSKISHNQYEISMYILHANLSWIITYFIFSKKNLYLRDGYFNRFFRITKRTSIFFGVLIIGAFLILPKQYSRFFLVEYTAIFYTGKLLFYFLLYKYLKFNRKKGKHVNKAVIVGYNDTAQHLHQIITSNYLLGYKFVGYLCSRNTDNPEVIGHLNELGAIIDQNQVQMVFVTHPISGIENKNNELLRICNKKGVRLRFVPENQRWYKSHYNMESVGNLVLINPQETPLDNLGMRVWKRLFDIAFSLSIILLVFSWLFPIIALIIKLSSKGPVFFVQKRTGMDNHYFSCIKFRSMQVNKDSDLKQATANDSRITRIGQFMRKTNLDEFPQFFNVLLGQMSVVGPRPHMLRHTEEYSNLIDYYLTRHYVKPGITGWAQVNGFRGETDELWKMQKRVDYDKEYIENWTFFWDMKIIWMTVFGSKAFLNAG